MYQFHVCIYYRFGHGYGRSTISLTLMEQRPEQSQHITWSLFLPPYHQHHHRHHIMATKKARSVILLNITQPNPVRTRPAKQIRIVLRSNPQYGITLGLFARFLLLLAWCIFLYAYFGYYCWCSVFNFVESIEIRNRKPSNENRTINSTIARIKRSFHCLHSTP